MTYNTASAALKAADAVFISFLKYIPPFSSSLIIESEV